MNNIYFMSTNEMKPNTCGSCKHTDNKLGFVSLRCSLLNAEISLLELKHEDDFCDHDKVRSWEKCSYSPSNWKPRI